MKYFIIVVACSLALRAQFVSPMSVPQPSPDMPSWCRYLFEYPLDVRALDSAYDDYYKKNDLVKSNYTRYYKRLRRAADSYVGVDGIAREPVSSDILNPAVYSSTTRGTRPRVQATQTWRAIGPMETYFSPGSNGLGALCPWQANIYTFDIAPSNSNILYAVGETGGFFKTTDKGLHWTQLESGVNSSSEAICIHPTNPDIVYVGVNGAIIKTSDGGKTWQSAWTLANLYVYGIDIHSSNTNLMYAATSQGFYRSTDAGASWKQILDSRICDLKVNTSNPDEVYLLRRNSAVNRYEFWKSIDAGASFTAKTNGWVNDVPNSGGARITVTPASTKRVYAVLLSDSLKPFIVRSDDAGETWTITALGTTTAFPMNNGQGFYDLGICASHTDADKLIVGTQTTYRSVDGGVTFTALGGYTGPFPIHPDLQEVKAKGTDTWIATDGGMTLSTDFFTDTKNAEARIVGINGADFWGFDAGWNDDVLVGGRYHNGNTAWYQTYGSKFYRMGGGEAATGYVNPIDNRRMYFSDIGSYTIPDSVNGRIIQHAVGKFPNESYYSMEYSSMVWDPRCSNTVWLGKDNTLWRSTDGAASYDSIFASGDKDAVIQHIAISRSNPSVMYVTQRSNTLNDGKIWKTTDEGRTWAATSNPPGTSGGERRVHKITMSATDENVLWIAYRSGRQANKVFLSTTGGATWTNLTTATIANDAPGDIIHHIGSDGGVYLACDRGRVYYRNNSMSDWELVGTGLPFALGVTAAKIFYRDNKIRLASSMGIWETSLVEHAKPSAQPCVDKRISSCPRDTFFFDDYSALERANARWHWSFPGASWVSDSTARNPRVVYAEPGTYNVSLSISNDYGNDTKTVTSFITMNKSECGIDDVADKALDMSSRNDVVNIGAIPDLKSAQEFTVSVWIKLDTIQQSFSQLLSNWSSDVGFSLGFSFQGYKPNTNLTFYWKNVPYQLTSPFNLPVDEWVHVACVVNKDKVTLYRNGDAWEYKNANANFKNFDLSATPWEIGGGLPGQGGNFRGQMDELQIFKRALSTDEIRTRMHLVNKGRVYPDTMQFPEPVAYYQFNESAATRFFNRYGGIHATNGGARLTTSAAPVAIGTSHLINTTGGSIALNSANVSLFTEATKPRWVSATRLFAPPNSIPQMLKRTVESYWIVRSYESTTALPYDSVLFDRIGALSAADADDPLSFKLYKRKVNDHSNTWTQIGAALRADTSTQLVAFGGYDNVDGQYLIESKGSSPLIVEDEKSNTAITIIPNPAGESATVYMNSAMPVQLRIVNELGLIVLEQLVTMPTVHIETSSLCNGFYTLCAGTQCVKLVVMR